MVYWDGELSEEAIASCIIVVKCKRQSLWNIMDFIVTSPFWRVPLLTGLPARMRLAPSHRRSDITWSSEKRGLAC